MVNNQYLLCEKTKSQRAARTPNLNLRKRHIFYGIRLTNMQQSRLCFLNALLSVRGVLRKNFERFVQNCFILSVLIFLQAMRLNVLKIFSTFYHILLLENTFLKETTSCNLKPGVVSRLEFSSVDLYKIL